MDIRGAFGFQSNLEKGKEKRSDVIMLLNNWGIGSFGLVPTRQARPSALGVRVMEPTRRAQSAENENC